MHYAEKEREKERKSLFRNPKYETFSLGAIVPEVVTMRRCKSVVSRATSGMRFHDDRGREHARARACSLARSLALGS